MSLSPPSQTSIYNKALALLGSTQRVSNTDDGQAVTAQLNELWPDCVRELLADHPWNCCIKRAVLNAAAAQPAFGDGKYFTLPPDLLRWLPWARGDAEFFEGSEEAGRVLLAEADAPLKIRYIALIENPGAWAPHMVSAMGALLAWQAAEPVTQSASIATSMRDLYHGSDGTGGLLMQAKEKDGLATGSRGRGNVERSSRALSAAGMGYRRGAK